MKPILALTAAVAIAALAAGAADAQNRGPVGSGRTITFYDLPNYQGPSRSFSSGVDNLADQGYNDRAQSARVSGVWRLCEDARMRGRCVDVSGDVPNLGDLRMSVQVSSFEPIGGQAGPGNQGGGYDPRPGGGYPGNGAPGGGYPGGGGYDPRPGGGYPGNTGPLPPAPGGGYGRDRDFAGPNMDGRTASFFPRPTPGPYRNADDFCRRLGFNGSIYADDRGRELRDVVCRR